MSLGNLEKLTLNEGAVSLGELGFPSTAIEAPSGGFGGMPLLKDFAHRRRLILNQFMPFSSHGRVRAKPNFSEGCAAAKAKAKSDYDNGVWQLASTCSEIKGELTNVSTPQFGECVEQPWSFDIKIYTVTATFEAECRH
jgi:hypothetical protein